MGLRGTELEKLNQANPEQPPARTENHFDRPDELILEAIESKALAEHLFYPGFGLARDRAM